MYSSFVRHLTSGIRMSRGALVVLEGCDRCGKTTQCRKVVETLNNEGIKSEMIVFPDRSTAIGKVINDYLEKKCELEDHAVHLLFAANRWELMPRMQKALDAGTTLIVDRYSFSGIAFSAAKPTLNLNWCRQPERGLIRPDAVIYFTLSPEEAAKRGQFGEERYEETTFQQQVIRNYSLLKDKDWMVIDASKSIEDLHVEIKDIVTSVISNVKDTTPGALWSTPKLTRGDNNEVESERSTNEPPAKRQKEDESFESTQGKHPVVVLVELCSKQKWGNPVFEMIHEGGADHSKQFILKVKVNGQEYTPLVASRSKRLAKIRAAELCLQKLEYIGVPQNQEEITESQNQEETTESQNHEEMTETQSQEKITESDNQENITESQNQE